VTIVLEEPLTAPVPLKMDEHGAIRVGGTRVTLDTVICAFNHGASAEEIVLNFSTLRLADVYAVLAYYLHDREQVDVYLRHREAEADAIQTRIEATYDRAEIRERLLARRRTQQST